MLIGQVARCIVVFSCFLCTCEVIGFLIAYYRVIMPMKQRLEADGSHLIAPPIWWVFWYHLLVGCMSTAIGVGIVINMHRGLPVSPTTFALAIIIPALVVVMKQFLSHYVTLLRANRSGTRE